MTAKGAYTVGSDDGYSCVRDSWNENVTAVRSNSEILGEAKAAINACNRVPESKSDLHRATRSHVAKAYLRGYMHGETQAGADGYALLVYGFSNANMSQDPEKQFTNWLGAMAPHRYAVRFER